MLVYESNKEQKVWQWVGLCDNAKYHGNHFCPYFSVFSRFGSASWLQIKYKKSWSNLPFSSKTIFQGWCDIYELVIYHIYYMIVIRNIGIFITNFQSMWISPKIFKPRIVRTKYSKIFWLFRGQWFLAIMLNVTFLA